ncbi:MAG: hypothetical protein IPF93_22145 [Saprospiraceae bacterium]|nr:hypothetical protein [Saprospiraceae bacterium]
MGRCEQQWLQRMEGMPLTESDSRITGHIIIQPIMDCELIGYDTTDVNGLYLFDSLLAGKYILALSQITF